MIEIEKCIQPKFQMNQKVWCEVTAQNGEFNFANWFQFTIVAVQRGSTTTGESYTYSLSNDPPSAYHCGKVNFSNIPEDRLREVKP